jgi:AcrR family transcriptional regulator
MPRTHNKAEYAVRRNEILSSAERLVFSKGFERMSIQDILVDLDISKGAFYHYFESKSALLEGITLRMGEEVVRLLQPIVDDDSLAALDKLEKFFGATARWKLANRLYLMALLRVWYHDDNILVRQRLSVEGYRTLGLPLISRVIRQGVAEGVLSTPYTDQLGEVLMTLFLGMGDGVAKALLELPVDALEGEREQCFRRMVQHVETYTGAIERILGAPEGSLKFFDLELLHEWVMPGETNGIA